MSSSSSSTLPLKQSHRQDVEIQKEMRTDALDRGPSIAALDPEVCTGARDQEASTVAVDQEVTLVLLTKR